MSNIDCLIFNKSDNVAINTDYGNVKNRKLFNIFSQESVTVADDVPWGHKIAISFIKKNAYIIKYGQVIGTSAKDIEPGEYVHTHNMKFVSDVNFINNGSCSNDNKFMLGVPDEFYGFQRSDRKVGTRNYIVLVSPVNCSATVVKRIAEHFRGVDFKEKNIDGVVPVSYGGGCAQSRTSYAYNLLNRTLAGWVENPNVVGVIFVGLCCESTCFESVMKNVKKIDKPVYNFNIRDAGGTTKAIQHGIDKVNNLVSGLPVFKRVALSVSNLNLALNCGGSDAFSSVTGNPALGLASDILVAHGGTSVLAEFPECHGAEELLIQRCTNEKDKDRLRTIIAWWKNYLTIHNVTVDDNLAAGNIEGGISTILEKSIGAVAKGGNSMINQVMDFAEHIEKRGLLFMNTPGFDPVSVTGLVAGGCNIVAFTTGRGSTYGCAIAPTIKISTNTALYEQMPDDIDINAGKILSGTGITDLGKEIYKAIVDVASGKQTKSEKNKLGWEEFVPWHIGDVL